MKFLFLTGRCMGLTVKQTWSNFHGYGKDCLLKVIMERNKAKENLEKILRISAK